MVNDWTVDEAVAEGFKVYVDGDVKGTFNDPITADNVKEIARAEGLKNISVRDTLGAKLPESAFPLSQNVVISQVNKAG